MGFEIKTRHSGGINAGVTIATYQRKGKPATYVNIMPDVIVGFDLNPGDRLALYKGVGEDLGTVLLEKNERGYSVSRLPRPEGALRLTISNYRLINQDKYITPTWKVKDENTLELKVPDNKIWEEGMPITRDKDVHNLETEGGDNVVVPNFSDVDKGNVNERVPKM